MAGEQLFPSLVISPQGGLVVWQDNAIDGTNGTGIAARRLDAGLKPLLTRFRVNNTLAGDQLAPQVVQLSGGNELFFWQSRVGSRQTVMARLLTNGAFAGADFKISPETTTNLIKYRTNWYAFSKNHYRKKRYRLKDVITNIRDLSGQAAAAALPDGSAVVVYQSARKHETNSWGLSRVWAWNGKRNVTNDLLVPTRVFVDWMQDVYFQRLSASGQKLGPEVQANQVAEFNQRSPAVAVLANGNFVLVWVGEHQARSFLLPFGSARELRGNNVQVHIYGRLFNSQGEPLGDEFQVSGPEDLLNANPAVAALAGGGFTVAWSQQEAAVFRRWDVVSRVFNGDGTPADSIQLVNAYTTGDQFGPKLAAVGDKQLVVWTSVNQDGSREGVYGRLLSGGAVASEEFRVNTTTISRQVQPALAADAQGRFLAVWASYAGETGFDVLGQGYSVPTAATPPAGGALVDQAYLLVEVNRELAGNNPVRPPLPPTPLSPNPNSPPVPGQAPPVVPASSPAPQLGWSGPLDKLQLHWNTQAGARYQIEVSADFKVWTAVGEPRTAAGATDAVGVNLEGSQSAVFYRVVQLR